MKNAEKKYPELEKEFECSITTNTSPEDVDMCRISNETGNIEVSPIFEFLDVKIQKLCIIQLQKLLELKDDRKKYFKADKFAIDKVRELYPETNASYFKRSAIVLMMKRHSSQNVDRCQAIIDSLYYESMTEDHGILQGARLRGLGDEEEYALGDILH